MPPTSHIQHSTSHAPLKNNVGLTPMYWHIGERINHEVLSNERATYGKQIVATVSRQLQEEFGTKGFDVKSIRRMMQFAACIPDSQIVAQLVI